MEISLLEKRLFYSERMEEQRKIFQVEEIIYKQQRKDKILETVREKKVKNRRKTWKIVNNIIYRIEKQKRGKESLCLVVSMILRMNDTSETQHPICCI